MWTLFKYLYRDASNYKAFGSVVLTGAVSARDRASVINRFESKQFFIAEQIGVPVLYASLYQWSDGPTEDDHCWHELDRFEVVEHLPIDLPHLGEATMFVSGIRAIEEWACELSPHFSIGMHKRILLSAK